MERDRYPIEAYGWFVAQRDIALLGLGLHRHLIAERGGDRIFGAEMDDALIAIHQDRIAVQRLGRDALGIDH